MSLDSLPGLANLMQSIEAKIVNLIENDSLDSFVDDCRFKNVNKINIKKLSEKLNCSDKTAKKMLQLHAPYILEL